MSGGSDLYGSGGSDLYGSDGSDLYGSGGSDLYGSTGDGALRRELDALLSSSTAIYMFVARSVGLYPAEAAQQFTVDNILQHCKDAKDVTCECDSRPG